MGFPSIGWINEMSDKILSVDNLLAQARTATGLENFGDNWFIEPLARLVEETNTDAGLIAPDAGAGQRILGALMDRLGLVQYFKDHPEAADEIIEPACAVIGLPRTGSTVIHRLLASAPQLTSLYWWETCFPLPFPDEKSGDPSPRIQMAHQVVDQLLTEWPDFESIDPIEAEAVAEEVILLDRTFLSTTYDSMMPIPNYGFWQAEQDHEPAYRDLLKFMQVIQHQRGGERKKWVLKTPHHLLGGINGLLAVFPNIQLVMTHRDVEQVLPSYCSMCASLSINASTSYDPVKQGEYWTRRFQEGLERFDKLRASLPKGQIVDVRYQDTVSDPIGTSEKVMTAIGVSFGELEKQAMENCIAENARGKRPKHKYSAEQFGLTVQGIADDFAAYHKTYLAGDEA
jgi:Sulfotransferase family